MATTGTAPAVAWPWPRTPAEVEREWLHVELLATRMTALAAPGTSVADLGSNGRCLLGIRAAAMWSTERTARLPISDREEPAGFWKAVDEIDAADRILFAHEPAWAYANGVARWLSWLIDAEETVLYPPV
jgi:hypothetical protein